jgi:hypothetical protein
MSVSGSEDDLGLEERATTAAGRGLVQQSDGRTKPPDREIVLAYARGPSSGR